MIQFQTVTAIYGDPRRITEEPWCDMVTGISEDHPGQIQLLGYKLMAGLSIFYVTPEVYEEGSGGGLIEPADRQIPKMTLEEMRSRIGHMALEVFPHALRETTVEVLTEALKRTREGPRKLGIKVYDAWRARRDGVDAASYPMENLCLDLEGRALLSYTVAPKEECFEHCYFPVFVHSKTYEDCVDRLAHRAYLEFQNAGDLFEIYRENDFYDVDRFLQRLYRFEFIFDAQRPA